MITITDKEFKQLSDYIKVNYGINLNRDKSVLVTGRLQSELLDKGFNSFSEYFAYLLSDEADDAVSILINKITTNHTYFMREAEHFRYYRDSVLPYLHKLIKDKDLRIWSAGCSSGEEPYTLAMINDEYFGKEKVLWDTKILATDISGKVLDDAKKGIYNSSRTETLPANWKFNYFNKLNDNNMVVNDKIRSSVIFRRFNLMDPVFPFKRKFHVIFCRNVMIYFDAKTRCELVNKFYSSLEHGGYLFIGLSEALNREETKLKYIMPAVYRKL